VRKEKIAVGFRGVLFFGSFFCTSKRNEQEKQLPKTKNPPVAKMGFCINLN
jgi:hypothetical protein